MAVSEHGGAANKRVETRTLREWLPWLGALGLTYAAGKLAVEPAKWIVLMYLAPGAEAKLILVNYLLSALLPVVLFAVPAFFCWRKLVRSRQRSDAVALLALEVIFVLYFDFFDLQRALADFSVLT